MNLINRAQANLFIQRVGGGNDCLNTPSGSSPPPVRPASSLLFSSALFFSSLCIQWFWQMLCVCVFVCVYAWQHSPWRVLTPPPIPSLPSSLSVSPSFLHPYTQISSLLLCFFPLFFPTPPPTRYSPAVSFVSAAVTTVHGGDAGQATRSFWQDMALGMGRLDRPGNSSQEISAHLS